MGLKAMLTSLHISQVVLIDRLSLDFAAGLTALTGETGAGKSILLDSLGLATGQRAESSLVRRGEDQAIVTAEFSLPEKHPVFAQLKEEGIAADSPLIMRRVLGADGRSRAFINDQPVSIGLLRSIGDTLVDIHGQFETYGLLNPQTHLRVLDEWTGRGDLLSETAKAHAAWRESLRALEEEKQEAIRAAENEAWIRSCFEELEELGPREGEEEELLALRQKLQSREAILEALGVAEQALASEDGADMRVGEAWKALHRVSDKLGEGVVAETLSALDRAAEEIQAASRQIENILADFDSPEYNAETLEDRLYALRGVARKHRCTVDDLPGILGDFSEKLSLLDRQDDRISELERRVDRDREAYAKSAELLHKERVLASTKLDKLVNAEMVPLKLGQARFETRIDMAGDESGWGASGFDQVQFVVATNAGTDAGPLNKIASGGEMARFMLALKVVLAESVQQAGVYVFDEIDTGIGGATASAVGERLVRLAKKHQVLVVTHSPQVAAQAGAHLVVAKDGGKTQITNLDAEGRREEIARMLAGERITQEARAAAGQLLGARG